MRGMPLQQRRSLEHRDYFNSREQLVEELSLPAWRLKKDFKGYCKKWEAYLLFSNWQIMWLWECLQAVTSIFDCPLALSKLPMLSL